MAFTNKKINLDVITFEGVQYGLGKITVVEGDGSTKDILAFLPLDTEEKKTETEETETEEPALDPESQSEK